MLITIVLILTIFVILRKFHINEQKVKGIPDTISDQKGIQKFKSFKWDQLFTLDSVYRLSAHIVGMRQL